MKKFVIFLIIIPIIVSMILFKLPKDKYYSLDSDLDIFLPKFNKNDVYYYLLKKIHGPFYYLETDIVDLRDCECICYNPEKYKTFKPVLGNDDDARIIQYLYFLLDYKKLWKLRGIDVYKYIESEHIHMFSVFATHIDIDGDFVPEVIGTGTTPWGGSQMEMFDMLKYDKTNIEVLGNITTNHNWWFNLVKQKPTDNISCLNFAWNWEDKLPRLVCYDTEDKHYHYLFGPYLKHENRGYKLFTP